MSLIHANIGTEQRVTASDLVRHFGEWQDRAARAPVYVIHRGRPRLVLTSLELMEALCAPHDQASQVPDLRIAGLLDAIDAIVLLVDRAGAIVAASRRARAIFGAAALPGSPIATLTADDMPFLGDAATRVLASGIVETAEIAAPVAGGRRLACSIEPLPDGAIVIARDVTVVDELATLRARHEAMVRAQAATESAAWVVIGLRGYIEDSARTLATITGLAPEALARARFANLIEIGSRVAVTDAIEGVIADAVPKSVSARLLVNRPAPIPVSIGLSAIRQGPAVEGVAASIVLNRPN